MLLLYDCHRVGTMKDLRSGKAYCATYKTFVVEGAETIWAIHLGRGACACTYVSIQGPCGGFQAASCCVPCLFVMHSSSALRYQAEPQESHHAAPCIFWDSIKSNAVGCPVLHMSSGCCSQQSQTGISRIVVSA